MTIRLYTDGLKASHTRRTITGRILPYGEPGYTNQGKVTASQASIKIPKDISRITLNLEHDPTTPLGHCTKIEPRKEGLYASFKIVDNTAGNDYLAEAKAGLRPGLSVEIDHPTIKNGRLEAGYLTAVAAVVKPAYASAGITSLAATLEEERAPEETTVITEEYTEITETVLAPDGTGSQETNITILEDVEKTYTPEEETPEEKEEEATDMGTEEEKQMTAARPKGIHTQGTTKPDIGFKQVASLMARAYATREPALMARAAKEMAGASQLFAALSDVAFDSGGAAGSAMTQPAWINELWSVRGYERKIVPLIGHADLTALKILGWRWKTKPTMATWSGNKSAVPSSAAATEAVERTAKRIAGANDIAREYVDFPMPEFWEGYYKAMAESYALQTDTGVLADLIAESTSVTAGAVPTNTPKALVYAVDAALSFIDTATPSFAVISTNLWRDLVLTPRDHTTEYLSAALGLEEGTAAGFKFIPASQMPEDSVLVGASAAATCYELPGSPIRVEALDISKGGVDVGLFGYYGTIVHDPKALAFVGTKPTPAGQGG